MFQIWGENMENLNNEFIEVEVVEDTFGSLYSQPIHLLSIYNSLKEYMKSNCENMDKENYIEDENILYMMKKIGEYDESDIIRLIDQMNFIDQCEEYSLDAKYAVSMGVLRLVLYDKYIMHHTMEEVNVLASAFNEVPLHMFSRYDSILHNDSLLKEAMKEETTEKARCYYLMDEMYEIDQLFEVEQRHQIH